MRQKATIHIKRIQHWSPVVADLERSRWFYGTVLGLEEIPRPRTFTFRGAWFRCGESEIHLIAASDTTAPPGMPDPGPGVRVGLAPHVAFEVDDLQALLERLAAHGIKPAGGPALRGDGAVQIWVFDPDGYLVEFFQLTGEPQPDAPERGPVREA